MSRRECLATTLKTEKITNANSRKTILTDLYFYKSQVYSSSNDLDLKEILYFEIYKHAMALVLPAMSVVHIYNYKSECIMLSSI